MLVNVAICRALSSKSRWKILGLLFERAMSISEIAKRAGLQPINVRYHLQPLIQIGLVEAYEEAHGVVGRPETYYRITGKHVDVCFPRRHYMFLSEITVNGLQATLGVVKATEISTRIGEEAGEDILKGLATKHNVKEWAPEVFRKFFVQGLLKELGTEPEVVMTSKREVLFRERNCLFQEVALKHPEIICDGLDAGFYGGITKIMGQGVKARRLRCMGHGDPYCEYSIKWQ